MLNIFIIFVDKMLINRCFEDIIFWFEIWMKVSFIEIIIEEVVVLKCYFFYILLVYIEISGIFVVFMWIWYDMVCLIFVLKLNRFVFIIWMIVWNLYINLKLISWSENNVLLIIVWVDNVCR